MKIMTTILAVLAASPAWTETRISTINRPQPESAIIEHGQSQEGMIVTSQSEAVIIQRPYGTGSIIVAEKVAPITPLYETAEIQREQEAEVVVTPLPSPDPKPAEITFDMIEFEFDKSTLLPEAYIEITEIAQILASHPRTIWIVEGHTDSVGSSAYNIDLSQRRAEAIISVLVSRHGVVRERLIPRGKGEAYPIADNNTDIGRQLNRRVVIIRIR